MSAWSHEVYDLLILLLKFYKRLAGHLSVPWMKVVHMQGSYVSIKQDQCNIQNVNVAIDFDVKIMIQTK